MRIHRLFPALLIFCCCKLLAVESPDQADKPFTDADFNALIDQLPKNCERAKSAMFELEFFRDHRRSPSASAKRRVVQSKGGKTVDVVLLDDQVGGVSGYEFSMALVIVENRIVDWKSCLTHNKVHSQNLELEDVDNDGFVDVAFRAKRVAFGPKDKRVHRRPGVDGAWLDAYSISETGFESLFPSTDRQVKVELKYQVDENPVKLEMIGLPRSLRGHQMAKCTISLTNLSNSGLRIKPGEWFDVNGIRLMTYDVPDDRTVLKAGESISQVVHILLKSDEDFAVECVFVPDETGR